ncbi:MAG: hypothetical protein HFJ84_11240 [Clostridiales bacterium]|jgi:hypothetical protein|nr:hypothetical protein [Clostridiales bacterium]
MNEKIQKLQNSIAKDQQKIQHLQLQIEKKNQQIESIKQEEIMKHVSSLEKRGMNIDAILKAIDEQDSDRLLSILTQEPAENKTEIPGQTNLEKESIL